MICDGTVMMWVTRSRAMASIVRRASNDRSSTYVQPERVPA
jgi:hypothetical protein